MDENGDVTVTVRFKCDPDSVNALVSAWLLDEFVNITFTDSREMVSGTEHVITTALSYVKEQ